jgi:hypothetical protein
LEKATSSPTLPERTLALATTFTWHNDALISFIPLAGTAAAWIEPLTNQVRLTRALQREALNLRDAIPSALLFARDVRAGHDRIVQLANGAVTAADQLDAALDLLRQARTGLDESMLQSRAATHIALAAQLTSWGAEDSLGLAGLFAQALRSQLNYAPPVPTPFSPPQHSALEAIVSGHVTVGAHERISVSRGPRRISLATVRALEARHLVLRTRSRRSPPDERLYLSSTGRQALAAVLHSPPGTLAPHPRSPVPERQLPTTPHPASSPKR